MPEKDDAAILRSMRRGKWYWVDKAVIQEHARREGLLTISVYHFLASMADKSQACYPSQKYIARKIGCSRGSVNKAIKRLAAAGMIGVARSPGRSTVYHLLPLEMSDKWTGVSDTNTRHVQEKDTNNNNVTRNNNNTVVSVPESYDETDEEAESKRTLLAHDIAEALGDHEHLADYLSHTERYTEAFLRRVLAETKLTPDRKIRKSRAALFNYLINHYAGK